MWCRNCNRETNSDKCELCGTATEQENPSEVYWCSSCKVPVIKVVNSVDKEICPICGGATKYLCADLRPVFPEERLLLELLLDEPFVYLGSSVWASNNRYYVDGKVVVLTQEIYNRHHTDDIKKQLQMYQSTNDDPRFVEHISKFVEANQNRLFEIFDEACTFIKQAAASYATENIVLSFSGGKDSTVTADLVVRALGNPSLVYLFGDTTLEFPTTMEYIERFRRDNPKAIIKTAKNWSAPDLWSSFKVSPNRFYETFRFSSDTSITFQTDLRNASVISRSSNVYV